MPAPVLLIGAGIALSRRGRGSNGSSARYSGDGYDSDFEDAIAGNENGGPGMVEGLKEKASDIGSRISEKAHETMENVRSMASDTAARVQDKFSSTYQSSRETATDTAQQMSEQMTETYYRTRDNMADMIERHPMLVGGVAFAVGSLVAASVPVSTQENKLMGETSDEIKRRGQDFASDGLQQAKTAAQQVYQTAASEIREQGMTPEAARNTARAAVEKARDVVEQTVSGITGGDAQNRSGGSSRNPNS